MANKLSLETSLDIPASDEEMLERLRNINLLERADRTRQGLHFQTSDESFQALSEIYTEGYRQMEQGHEDGRLMGWLRTNLPVVANGADRAKRAAKMIPGVGRAMTKVDEIFFMSGSVSEKVDRICKLIDQATRQATENTKAMIEYHDELIHVMRDLLNEAKVLEEFMRRNPKSRENMTYIMAQQAYTRAVKKVESNINDLRKQIAIRQAIEMKMQAEGGVMKLDLLHSGVSAESQAEVSSALRTLEASHELSNRLAIARADATKKLLLDTQRYLQGSFFDESTQRRIEKIEGETRRELDALKSRKEDEKGITAGVRPRRLDGHRLAIPEIGYQPLSGAEIQRVETSGNTDEDRRRDPAVEDTIPVESEE